MLYNKYAPKRCEDILGNKAIKEKLKYWEERGFPHSILLSGEKGTGKGTTTSMIQSMIPKCYLENVTASVESGVDKAREIASKIHDIPIGYSNKLILLNESHRGTPKFFDSLLDVMENTPDNVWFVINTTEISKIPDAIKSRCLKLKTSKPKSGEMLAHLEHIAMEEGIVVTKKVLRAICSKNGNAPRDSIADLELLLGIDDEKTQLELLGKEDEKSSVGYQVAVGLQNKFKWDKMSALLTDVTENDVEGIRRVVLNYHKKVLLGNGSVGSANIIDKFKDPFYDSGVAGLVLACFDCV